MIYGEYDWMNWRNAADVKAGLQANGGAPQMDVWRVAQATHQQMIDNPRGFADAVLATGGDTAGIPAGAGFGAQHGAHAKVWVRDKPLPQDADHITIWADESASGNTAVEYTSRASVRGSGAPDGSPRGHHHAAAKTKRSRVLGGAPKMCFFGGFKDKIEV
eukprot:7380012-Prymnesium_polylepis.1